MEYFDNTTACSELSIAKARELRCTGDFPSCGSCESCEIGGQLTFTKQWFLRCGEQLKRQFVIGLVHRFKSLDLHEYINTVLTSQVEGKDFTYTRSRNRPSLKEDVSGSPSNHALDKWQVHKDMVECLNWFEARPYWTKCNFMLGIMQKCNAHLLQIIGSESRSLCLLNNSQDYNDVTEAKNDIDITNDSADQSSHPKVTFAPTHFCLDESNSARTSPSERPRSALKQHSEKKAGQDGRPILGVSFSNMDETWEPKATSSRPASGNQSKAHEINSEHKKSASPRPSSGNKLSKGVSLSESTTSRPLSSDNSGRQSSCELRCTSSIPSSGNKLSNKELLLSDTTSTTSKSKKESSYGPRSTSSRPSSGNTSKSRLDYEGMGTDHELDPRNMFEALDDDYISVDPSSITDPAMTYSFMSVQRFKDFIRCLPVHLSKLILSYLDKASLVNCLCISKHWRVLTEEVQQDTMVHQIKMEEVMMMQGATAKGLDATYAKKLAVCIPKYDITEQKEASSKQLGLTSNVSNLRSRQNELEFRSMAYCYEDVETTRVDMEERNLFCGAYNVFVLQHSEDRNRVVTYNGGHLVACGSSDRRVRLLDVSTGRSERTITGHAGSVKCLYISEKRGIVLSGSYDTSIRCWDLKQRKCQCIFYGHSASVLCLSLDANHLASGSRDRTVKVWNFETGRCRRTFRHHQVVLCVEVHDDLVVSGCEGCKVRVWAIESATLIKTLEGHHCPITGITFNKYHIISSSKDSYALAWSTIGKYKKCLQAFRHAKEVICVKLLYCRVITGAADGKLRVWNLLTGDCLRTIRGNSKSDIVTSLYIVDNRMVINTPSNLLVLNFEAVTWNYDLPPDRPESLGNLHNYSNSPPCRRAHSYVRAQKHVRGAQVQSLISSTALTYSPFNVLDRSISMTPCAIQASTSRVSSAPSSYRVTRQITQSIDHHVQRLAQARHHPPTKPRPHSSPAKIRHQSKLAPDNNTKTQALALKQNLLVREEIKSAKSVGSFPGKHSHHHDDCTLSRGRSAPAFRTEVLPGNQRGWTTSAKAVTSTPHNKLMPTALQSCEITKKQRPKSTHILAKTGTAQAGLLKSVSCLNLRTHSAEDEELERLKMDIRNKQMSQKKKMKASQGRIKMHQPLSSVT